MGTFTGQRKVYNNEKITEGVRCGDKIPNTVVKSLGVPYTLGHSWGGQEGRAGKSWGSGGEAQVPSPASPSGLWACGHHREALHQDPRLYQALNFSLFPADDLVSVPVPSSL